MADKKVRPTKKVNKKVVRRKFRYKRFFAVLFILGALIYGAFAGYGYLMERQAQNLAKAQEEVIEANAKEVKPEIDAQFNDARFEPYENALLIGVDDVNPEGSWDKNRNADAIELLSLDDENDVLRVVTIPRNLVVIPDENGQGVTISQIYYEQGGVAATDALAKFLGIPITQYIAIDRNALKEIVDALDGVDIYIPQSMNYEDPTNGTSIHLSQGYQHLDGEKAADYLSFRSDELGDSGRIQRQQQFLKLIYEKFTSMQGIKAAPKLFKVMRTDADTNVKATSIKSMVNFINAINDEKIEVRMLPGTFDAQGNWIINKAGVKNCIDELFPEPEEKAE